MSRKKQAKKPTDQSGPTPGPGDGGQPATKAQLASYAAKQEKAASQTALEQMRSDLEAARTEAAESLDKFLRAKAEADNTRRRAEIDVANAHKYGIERFASELLAVRDSLELARTVDIPQENETALEKMHEGLDLTLKLIDSVFQKFALTVIDPKGEKFDPEKHQAMSIVETEKHSPGQVVDVVQKGYMLHDRLLRPAMVVVAKAPTEKSEGTGT